MANPDYSPVSPSAAQFFRRFVSRFALGGIVGAVIAILQSKAFAAPDLTVRTVDGSSTTTDSQTLEISGVISATVRNIGGAGTGAGLTVLFFEDANENGKYDAGTDRILATSTTPALAANEERAVPAPISGTVTSAET